MWKMWLQMLRISLVINYQQLALVSRNICCSPAYQTRRAPPQYAQAWATSPVKSSTGSQARFSTNWSWSGSPTCARHRYPSRPSWPWSSSIQWSLPYVSQWSKCAPQCPCICMIVCICDACCFFGQAFSRVILQSCNDSAVNTCCTIVVGQSTTTNTFMRLALGSKWIKVGTAWERAKKMGSLETKKTVKTVLAWSWYSSQPVPNA